MFSRFFRSFGFIVLLGGCAQLAKAACDADIEQYCFDVQPGYGALSDCMNQHMDKFSYQCREWIKKSDQVLRKLGSACTSDTRNFCRDVRPGYGRIKSCLMANKDK